MKKNLLKRFWTLIFVVYATLYYAQPPLPGEGDESGGPGGISQPIDSYVMLLLLIGIALIAITVYKKNKAGKKYLI